MHRLLATAIVCVACFLPALGHAQGLAELWEEDVAVSGSARLRGLHQENFNFSAADVDRESSLDLRVRLATDLRLADGVFLRLEGQGQRLAGSTFDTISDERRSLDAREASLELTSLGPEWLTVKAGRFPLQVASGRLFSEDDWHLTGRWHDGLVATLRATPFQKYELLALRVGRDSYAKAFDEDGSAWLAGVYGHLDDMWFDDLEPFVLFQDYDNEAANAYLPQLARVDGAGHYRAATLGVRVTRRLVRRLEAEAEIHAQVGEAKGEDLRSHLLHFGVGYDTYLPVVEHVSLAHSRYSGDANRNDGTLTTYQPLFSSAFDQAGLIGWFGLKNLAVTRLSVSGHVVRGLSWRLTGYDFRRLKQGDALYFQDGTVSPLTDRATEDDDFGREVDLSLAWELDDAVRLRGTASWLFPGGFVDETLARRGADDEEMLLLTMGVEVRI